MKTRLGPLLVGLVFLVSLCMTSAEAASRTRRTPSMGRTSGVPSSQRGTVRQSGTSTRSRPRPSDSVSRPGQSNRSSNRGDWSGLNDLLNGWDRYGRSDRHGDRGGYPWEHSRHDRDDAYADAYRDVGIANAIVNLVGVIVSSSQTYPAYAPQPAERVVREKVLVREGYREDYQVWVPDHEDAQTGDLVRGHYETRSRYVPDEYEIREYRTP